jgi:hypothetical protein
MKVVKILAGVVGIVAFMLMLYLIYGGIFCWDSSLNYECERLTKWIGVAVFGVVGIGLLIFTNRTPFSIISGLLFAVLGVIIFIKGGMMAISSEDNPIPGMMATVGGALTAVIGIAVAWQFVPQNLIDFFQDD